MIELQVITDGTIAGTKLMVDGKDVTKEEKVISVSVHAFAPYKSKHSGEVQQGYVTCSYEVANDNGTFDKKSYGTTDTPYTASIGSKISNSDAVIRFIGHETDKERTDLVDRIIRHCETSNIKCPSREVLLSRSMDSLKDKALDLGIKIEDNQE